MKTQVQNPPAISSTIIRLVFVGSVLLGCVYMVVSLFSTALSVLR